MYHQEPEFRLSPMAVEDDRIAQNRHRLELPVWFYIRYPGRLELKPDIIAAIAAICPDLRADILQIMLDRMPSIEECAALHELAQHHGCTLVATQRNNEEFERDRRRIRAIRTGSS